MRVRTVAALAALGVVCACGKPSGGPDVVAKGKIQDVGSAGEAVVRAVERAYDLRFRVPGERMAGITAAAEDACEALGPGRCVVLGSSLDGSGGRFGSGSVTMVAAADVARPLSRRLARLAAADGGSLTRMAMTGEALDGAAAAAADAAAETRVDVRAAEANAADAPAGAAAGTRAAAPPAVRSARVAAADAAAAARAGAREARAAARVLTARVATSRITAQYESEVPVRSDRGRPLAAAWAQVGERLEDSAALLLTVVTMAAPFALVVLAAAWARRAWRRRWPADARA